MFNEQIEFVDFIFDRYAFLKVDQHASKAEIETRVREMRAQNHPDRLTHLGDDLKAAAAANWLDIDKCAEVLLNDELRPLFDQRLAHFREKTPQYITKNSRTIIIDPDRDAVNIRHLVNGDTVDIAGLETQSLAISGYNPKEIERARKFYQRDPEDVDILASYQDALRKKILYLQIMEKYLWGAAGIQGKNYTKSHGHMMDTGLLGEAVTAHIAHIREKIIPEYVTQRSGLLALGYDKNPVLLLPHQGSLQEIPEEAAVNIKAQVEIVQSRFTVLTEAIEQNVAETAAAINELLKLSPYIMLHENNADVVIVHLMCPPEDNDDMAAAKSIMSWQMNESGVDIVENMSDLTIDELRSQSMSETNVAILYDRHLNEPSLSMGYAYKKALSHFGLDVELAVKDRSDETTEVTEAANSPFRPDERMSEHGDAPAVLDHPSP